MGVGAQVSEFCGFLLEVELAVKGRALECGMAFSACRISSTADGCTSGVSLMFDASYLDRYSRIAQ